MCVCYDGARAPHHTAPRWGQPANRAAHPRADGFDTPPFDRGVLDIRRADDSTLLRQVPLPAGAACCSAVGVLVAGVSVIGWPYLCAKTHLIRKGEIGLAEWNSGNIRVLTPGWHLLECVNTSVARFRVTSDVIQHGAMKVIRVRPGFIGLGTENGRPVLLQAGALSCVPVLAPACPRRAAVGVCVCGWLQCG